MNIFNEIVAMHFSENKSAMQLDIRRQQDVDANILEDPSCRVCANNAVQSDDEVLEQSYFERYG